MSRSLFKPDPTAIYHITGRCRNQDWFDLPMEYMWEMMSEQLYFLHHAFSFQILSFVLMSNHFHLITMAPLGNMSDGMQHFMGTTSRYAAQECGRKNQVWSSRFFRSRLSNYWYAMNCYKYVYYNPVQAGICLSPEDYKFSTLNGLIGQSKLIIPVTLDSMLFDEDLEKTLKWLNLKPNQEAWESVERGLYYADFQLPKINQRRNPWEEKLI